MKKYSEKFIHEYDKLKNSRIGFEMEFYMRDLSFYKTLEMLNIDLSPVKVHGLRQYHSDFVTDSSNFKIEPDLSGGSNMVELITGPLDYVEAKYYLLKILKFIQKYGYTNEKSSIHFNVSFTGDKNLNDLNVLKLILNTDEDEIYRFYPSRKNNMYAKSIKNIIPYKEYDFFNVSIETVKNSIRIPDEKYFGINFLNINNDKESQRLEYRYLGGKDYEQKVGDIIYFLDRFILDVYNSIDVGFNQSDADQLESYLEINIEKFRSFSKYDNFIVEFPKIQIQVDQNQVYELVNSYFSRIYPKIWDLVDSDGSIQNCIINYVTQTQTIEIVDLTLKSNLLLKNYDFINCTIDGGIFQECNFYGCESSNSQISKSRIDNSEISKSKILDCTVESSVLDDCYFMGGHLNSDMIGGVYRSGELGPNSSLSPETKIVNDYSNFFDTRMEDDKSKDSLLKSYKK